MAEYKTIGEVSDMLNVPQHVLRFWETEFRQIKPNKRRGNRRFYNEKDIEIIENVRILLHVKGYTIKGAKKALLDKNQGFLFSNDIAPKVGDDKKSAKTKSPANTTPRDNAKLEKVLKKLKEAQELIKSSA